MMAASVVLPGLGCNEIDPTVSAHANAHEEDEMNTQDALNDSSATPAKKKKKKKPKKSKLSPIVAPATAQPEVKPTILRISRNKHWRYISSYHGPWLQLPIELLESLLALNLDPTNFTPKDERIPLGTHGNGIPSFKRSPSPSSALSNAMILRRPVSKPTPPPIDPGIFKSVAAIRRLIDEASDLAVRAASGVTTGTVRSPVGNGGGGQWAAAQALGLVGGDGSGRGVAMSNARTHRLRVLAVQKLASAYKADEIAASVMVMQGASALDDLAERVLKVDPDDLDAKYVHFFHEKIPSRQLAEHTTTQVLDDLIEAEPTRLHYFRTRGTVRCFRDEYALAIKDFTHALKESKAQRKARSSRHTEEARRTRTKSKQQQHHHHHSHHSNSNGQDPPSGTSALDDADAALRADKPNLHPSVGPDAPDPLEPQVLFLRAATYLQNAIYLIEVAILNLEGIDRVPAQDALELRIALLERGKYGGISSSSVDGPLGSNNGVRLQAYRKALAEPTFREQVSTLLRKAIRDHEKFSSFFDTVDGALPTFDGNLAKRVESAFLLSEALRPGSQTPPPPVPENPGIFTTYHPLLVESHFSILLCHLLLGNFGAILPAYQRAAALVDGLEGYPVFLPARSMAQAEFVEILERIINSWPFGLRPHSLSFSKSPTPLLIEPAGPIISLGNGTPISPSPMSSLTAGSSHVESIASTRAPSPTTEGDTLSELSSDPTRSSLALTKLSGDNGIKLSQKRRTSRDEYERAEADIAAGSSVPGGMAANLDCLRMLLAPIAARQKARREEAEFSSSGKGVNGQKKQPLSINIPLHGPRADLALAFIAAVHLPELEGHMAV